jgi:orotate phosphoribosyltransferase
MVNAQMTTMATQAGEETARILIEIKAVNFRPAEPYKLTAGWMSPVYIDCRKLISFLPQRRRVVELGAELLRKNVDMTKVDLVAGGETAGIPYGAWFSEALDKPMLYIRKQPKGFGRGAQIEGDMPEGSHVLLVEDLATDGGSKVNFVNAIRAGNASVTDIFVVFFYGAFPGADESMAKMGTKLHYLATWTDVLAAAEKGNYFTPDAIQGVRDFLKDPIGWSAARGGRDKL